MAYWQQSQVCNNDDNTPSQNILSAKDEDSGRNKD